MHPGIESNKQGWDSLVPSHLQSNFYDVAGFLRGNSSLNPIELEALGDVAGRSLLHLQCHFGLDTLSWARKGARVYGVDFSPVAVETARRLAEQSGLSEATFVCDSVLDLDNSALAPCDIVFTSYGVLGWLPDLKSWAASVARYLKPGGTFLVVEFHPALLMLDFERGDFGYDYFHRGYEETHLTSYAGAASAPRREYTWSHSLEDVVEPLLASGLTLESLREFDFSPYGCFDGMVEEEPGCWRFPTGVRFPHLFSLKFRG